MDEGSFKTLTGEDAEGAAVDVGKNKILFLALDNSGSMSGAPINALKMGAQLIGDKYFESEQPPFEQLHVYTYNNSASGF